MHISSAYRFEAVSSTACGRSLIYIKKKSGPKIDLCGTPHVIKPSSGKTLSSNTEFSIRKVEFKPFNDCFLKPIHIFQEEYCDLKY